MPLNRQVFSTPHKVHICPCIYIYIHVICSPLMNTTIDSLPGPEINLPEAKSVPLFFQSISS